MTAIKKITSITLVFSLVICTLALAGCTKKSGGTITEPDITVEYLASEYKDTLVKDGATEIIGTLASISTNADAIESIVHGKEIIESADEELGYYIADKNTALPVTMDVQTRVVYGSGEEKQILTLDQFVGTHNGDIENGRENLYRFYSMGTQVILILPFELEK